VPEVRVLEEAELRSMSPQERASLMRRLAELDRPLSAAAHGGRSRAVALAFIVVCCVALAIWIGILAVTLPRYYRSGGWRGAWVGFDIAELVAFATTGWAAWRRRQILIICLVVLATLLCCDAWFDVVLDARTRGFEISLVSALLVELPLAALAIIGARRLLRTTIAVVRHREGHRGPLPPLWRIPLFSSPGGNLGDLFAVPQPHRRGADADSRRAAVPPDASPPGARSGSPPAASGPPPGAIP
jgi:hypothetical protein